MAATQINGPIGFIPGFSPVPAPQAGGLETLGQLTDGLAHDFNNLLTVVINATEALADQVSDPQAHRLAQVAHDAAERGADLVGRMLSLARRRPGDLEPLDCAEVVEATARLARLVLADNIRLRAIAPAGLTCATNLAELQSALLNLCINARDAMPGGGDIDLTAEPMQVGGASFAAFTVRDTGKGMPAEVIARAREPYFTTKGERGSGLGLACVETFARRHGGGLSIASAEGRGAVVSLYLPAPHSVFQGDRS